MADKKISQLPLLNSVSGSSLIVPIVHDGTTVKLDLNQLGHFSSQWSAQTGSANTFTGNQTIVGNLNLSGNSIIGGNVEIGGMITAQQYNVTYVSSSVQYQSGSTEFGDSVDDTHTFTGTINLNGLALGTPELMAQTASQAAVNLRISSTTGSINTTTSSFDSVFLGISSVTGAMNTQSSSQDLVNRQISSTTGSINTTTSSFDNVFLGISSVTGAMNTQSSSQDLVNRQVSLVTGSIHFVTGAFNAFTGSVVGQTNTIATFTSSVNFTTQSLNTQTGSQDLVNFRIASTTGSMNTTTSSFDLVFRGISSVTGAMNTQSSSQDLINRGISSVTGSINTTTSSFDLVFRGISSVTGAINLTTSSLIGITNGLMAFTAALDNTYATDAQLYQLYQATSSIHFATQSLNIQTGSIGSVLSGLSNVTSAYATTFNSIDAHILKQSIQTGSQESINTTISIVTGSLRAEVGDIESYTASLKAAAIVSSSTQISNYYKFAETASASTTFYGNVIGASNVQANKFVFTDAVINTNVGGQKIVATSGNILYLYSGTSGLYINNQANDTTIAQFTNAGQLTIGGPGNDQNLVFGGTNSSIYWGSGGPARMYYNVGDIKISSAGATDVLNVKNIGGISVSGGITGSLMATNGVVSGSQQIIDYNKFPLTASANTFWGTQTFSGSFNVSGSTVQSGNNTLTGNTVLSGSINVSGSSNFNNSVFIVTGSSFFTGSHEIRGNSIFSGSINIASGSSYYRAGNKLFNYGQWASLETQSGSANTAYAVKLDSTTNGSEGIYIANNGSGFPTRITAENTGLYNVQFSFQLNTTSTETCDFSVWYAMTGSNVANSNTDFSIDKTAGGGNGVAALNFLTHITANDYVEIYWSKSTANGQLVYKAPQSTPTRPATPSAIVTITQVA